MKENQNLFITSDIGLAAFLLMKGIKIISAKNTRPFSFEFDNYNNVCNQLSLEFLNSEASRFDDAMKKIKTIMNNSK